MCLFAFMVSHTKSKRGTTFRSRSMVSNQTPPTSRQTCTGHFLPGWLQNADTSARAKTTFCIPTVLWWPRRATASANRLCTYRARGVKYCRARCSRTARGVVVPRAVYSYRTARARCIRTARGVFVSRAV